MSKKVYKNFLFNEDRDQDILDWLNSLENQSNEVRNAIRMYMARNSVISDEVSLADVLDEINNLSHKIDSIKIIKSNETVEPQELPDLVAKLRNFGV